LNAQEQFPSQMMQPGGQIAPESIFRAEPEDYAEYTPTTWAAPIVVDTTGSYDQIWFYSYNPDPITNIAIASGASNPTTPPLDSGLVSIPPMVTPGWHVIVLDTPLSLTASDKIWIVLSFAGQLQYRQELALIDGNTDGLWGHGYDPVQWNEAPAFPCRAIISSTLEYSKYFEYKGALYNIRKIDGGIELWMNGYRGTTSAGTTGTATDGTQSWSTNELAGKIFMVVGGVGMRELRRWRRIASNNGTVITFEDGYTQNLGAQTDYVILGTDTWTEIASGTHGIVNIFDVVVANFSDSLDSCVYFLQGGTTMRRMREYNNSGTWTRQFDDDGSNNGNYMVQVGNVLWRAQNLSGNLSRADIVDAWGTDLTFEDVTPCGDKTIPFTGLDSYVEEGYAVPVVLKEDIVGYVDENDAWMPLNIKEMASLRSEKNGRAHLVHDTYLYFSLGDGLEQYFNPEVKDIGPNKDEGLPEDRQGPIVTMRGYPGRILVGVDGGSAGYSSILSRSGGGWHEEWTGPYGQKMWDIYSQVIPGNDNVNRLWIAYGGDITWMPIAPNPLIDSNYLYTAGGYLESATMSTDMKTILKVMKSIKLAMREAGEETLYEVKYRINGGSWSDIYTVTGEEIVPTYDNNILDYELVAVQDNGDDTYTPLYGNEFYDFQYRINLVTNDNTTTPVVRAIIMELLGRIESKYIYTVPFVIFGTATDPGLDLNNETDDIPAASTKLSKLLEWASGGVLYMESMDPRFDKKMVLLRPFAEGLSENHGIDGYVEYLGQLTLQDA